MIFEFNYTSEKEFIKKIAAKYYQEQKTYEQFKMLQE